MNLLASAMLMTFWASEASPAPPPQEAPYAAYQTVEVADAENPGQWRRCTVIEAFIGAYEVSCDYTHTVVRDIHVRLPGGQPVGQTAAQPVSGPPFKSGDLVLASVMGLPDDWRLCTVVRNAVESGNHYVVRCGRSPYNALPRWVRVDPAAPH